MQLFLFRWRIFVPDLVCEALDHLLFQIHIEGKLTDEGKESKVFLIVTLSVLEGSGSCLKFRHYIVFQSFALLTLQ